MKDRSLVAHWQRLLCGGELGNAAGKCRPFAVFESADLGAAKRTLQALLALASARQPENSLGVGKFALQGEVPPGAAGAGAMNSRGSNLNGWRSMWRVTVA